MDDALKEYYGFGTAKKSKKPAGKKLPSIVKEIKKHTLPEVNYAFQKTISFSQLSMFSNCPHKWALQYKDGYYTSEASINMTFGTALHETLQHYITTIYEKSGAEADRIDLEKHFEERFGEVYLKDYKSNKNVHFSNSVEMREFFEDGVAILKYIKKHRSNLFNIKGWYLIGCEVPILLNPNYQYNNILFKGFLDVVLYNKTLDKFKIIDIKTSTKGWSDKEKKDETKQFQLILYKHFFSKQFGVPVDNIDIEFFIVKRKIWEEAEFEAAKRRVQEFIPASGKVKVNKAVKTVDEFIESVFNNDGTYKNASFSPNPSAHNCRFCPFKENKELCDKGLL